MKTNNHGGARPGAGRPKGSGNKIRLEDLLSEIETVTGRPYAEQLAYNYAGAISREDWTKVENYDRAFLNKIVADKSEVEISDSAEAIENKRAAFADAIRELTGLNNDKTVE